MTTQTTVEPSTTGRRSRLRLVFEFGGATAAGAAAALTAAQLIARFATLRGLSHGLGVIGLGGDRRTRSAAKASPR